MAPNDILKRLVDAGAQLSETSQARAEALARDLARAGELRRQDAERAVQQLIERGRETTDELVSRLQDEWGRQLDWLTGRIDELESAFTELAIRVGLDEAEIRRVTQKVSGPTKAAVGRAAATAKKAPAKKAPAKRATAKKAPAKKATATKAPAKRATAKKAPAKQAPAKRATAKKATAKKAPAKKAPAKKAPAKKAPAKKAASTR